MVYLCKPPLVRIETRTRLDSVLVEHIQVVSRPPPARPVDPDVVSVQPPIVLGTNVCLDGAGAAAGREAIARTRPKVRGREPMECVHVHIGGPPPYPFSV